MGVLIKSIANTFKLIINYSQSYSVKAKSHKNKIQKQAVVLKNFRKTIRNPKAPLCENRRLI